MIRNILTRVEWRSLKLLCPLLIHLDGGGVVLRVLRAEPEVVGVLEEGGEVVGVGGVHHVEEELAVRQVGLGALLGEELGQLLLLMMSAMRLTTLSLSYLGTSTGRSWTLGMRCFRPAKTSFRKSLFTFFLGGM